MRILIIDDDKKLMLKLRKNLEARTFAVDTAENGEDGSYMARVNNYDIIILDDSLPKKSCLEVCREIRGANKTSPIMVISAKSTMQQKISLFHEGADDLMMEPFSFEELLARIQAILRRPPLQHKPVLDVDTIRLDCHNQEVRRGDKRVYLTRKEFALLEYLMRNKGSVVSRGMIMEHVWDDATDPFSNTIESHILNLRKKIDHKRKRLIHNIPGRGYKIDVLK
ncbi:TPA: DNA-binding response regulator [Candidatus Taylorbacteria bacterium]|nr:DNA-binding response regulator [Candidatus Taylorbacteria bacterium]